MEKEHVFKKKYGQNFLKEQNIIKKIVSTAHINNNALIIEIGPGAGALTEELVTQGQVLAYEIDKELIPVLEDKFSSNKNITFIFDDFLQRNIVEDIKAFSYDHLYVVANLPYYITTPIINKIIESKIDVEKMVLMVQKEVGDRFCALPQTKEYGSITVFLNYYFEIKKEFIVSKNCFIPKPNVDSMIISLTKKTDKVWVSNEEQFFRLVRDSFQYKRKNLRNNLKQYNIAKVEEVLIKYQKDLNVRAEELPLEVFASISNNL